MYVLLRMSVDPIKKNISKNIWSILRPTIFILVNFCNETVFKHVKDVIGIKYYAQFCCFLLL